MMNIRLGSEADHDAVWKIFHVVVGSGDTYVFEPEISRENALAYWFRGDTHTYVAEDNGDVLGTYILRANQPGLGSHVANASFMVAPSARGRGVGMAMGEHCLAEAARLGFRAMQFNIVVSTNETAVRLWQRLGFRTVGVLPKVYRHASLGFVDAYVMFRELG